MSLARPRPARRFPRLTLRVDVSLETREGRIDAVATTLGAGGLFVGVAEPPPVHTPLLARFRLPDDPRPVRMAARVAWTAAGPPCGPGMGVEFVDSEARSRLAAHLEAWAKRGERDAGRRGDGS